MTISAGTAQPDTGEYPVVRLIAAFTLMTVGLSAMYATIAVLKPVAIEVPTGRGAASLPYMLFMLGFGLGGVMMAGSPTASGSWCRSSSPGGAARLFLAAAQAQTLWQFCSRIGRRRAPGRVIDVLAPGPDISHWFTKGEASRSPL